VRALRVLSFVVCIAVFGALGASALVRGPAASASATVTTSNFQLPLRARFSAFCLNGGAGEYVLTTGTLHISFQSVDDGAGGLHFRFLSNTQGAVGVGETTGTVYRSSTVAPSTTNLKAGETTTEVRVTRFSAPGPDNNFYLQIKFRVTINANGEPTVEIDEIKAGCP
jgi:hypothetical protein